MKKLFFLISLVFLGVKADDYLLAIPVDAYLIQGVQKDVSDIFQNSPFNKKVSGYGRDTKQSCYDYKNFNSYNISLIYLKDPNDSQLKALQTALESLKSYQFNLNLSDLFFDSSYRDRLTTYLKLSNSSELDKLEIQLLNFIKANLPRKSFENKYNFINRINLGQATIDSDASCMIARRDKVLGESLSKINVPFAEIVVNKLVLYKSQDGQNYQVSKTYDLREQTEVEKIIDACLQ